MPADHRHRVHLDRGCGLHLRHGQSAGATARLSARIAAGDGVEFRGISAVSGGDRARRHGRAWRWAGMDAVGRAGPRRGGQSAHGARARHQCRRPVRGYLCVGQRACRPRRRARHRNGRTRSFVRLYLPHLRADRGIGGRTGLDRGIVRRRHAARCQRRRRQVLRARYRGLSHLSGDDRAPDVAADRIVRETLGVTIETVASPHHYLQAQIRWRWSEILFWLATLLPFVLTPSYLVLASQIAITALFALSLDLILGFCGIISLGHAAYFGVGAYAAGLASKWGWGEPLSGLLIAALAAGSFGYVTSFIVVRFRHLALIMITLGLGLLLQEAANSASWLTGGFDGLQGIHTWPLFGRFHLDIYGYTAYGYSLAGLFVIFLVARRIIHSPFGLALRGIRENSQRMPAIGAPIHAHIRTIY